MAAPLRSDSPTPAPDWSRPGHQKFTRKRKKSGAAGHSKGGGQAAYAAQQTLGIHKVITINSARPPFVDHPNRRVAQTNVIVPGEVIGDPNSGLPIGAGLTVCIRNAGPVAH